MTTEALNTGTTTDTGTQPAATPTAPAVENAAPIEQASATPTAQAPTESTTKAAPAGAPEKYEFKAAEGQTFEPSVMTEFEGIARELNLPQEAAQKLVDKMAPTIAKAQQETLQRVQTEWSEAAKTDKEFGGEKLTENLAIAKKALDQFGTPELRTLLNDSGLGNNPEVIRAFYRAGKAISQDTFVPGGVKGPQGGGDLASRLYPSQKS